MSEQKRSSADVATGARSVAKADDIFLSPRVVDRQAFNDFAAQLRELIEQAGAQAEALRSAAGEAQRSRDGLRDAMNANQMKLDLTSRALATIDQKAEQTRRMIDGASDVASRLDGLREQADQVITERVGILCQRLNEAEEAATTQIDDLHAKLAGTIKCAGEREAALKNAVERAAGPLTGQLAELVDRAEATIQGENGLGAIVQRAEAAGRTASRATSELSEVRLQAEQARKMLGEAMNAAVPIIDDAGTIQGHLEATVSEAVRMSQNARESMVQFVASERRAIEADIQRLAPLAEQTRADLESLVRQTEAARVAAVEATTGAERAARGLEALLKQVEPWRRVLIGETGDAPVGAAISGVVVELRKELHGVAGALRALADRTESALEPDPPAAMPAVRVTPTRRRSAAAPPGTV